MTMGKRCKNESCCAREQIVATQTDFTTMINVNVNGNVKCAHNSFAFLSSAKIDSILFFFALLTV